jgi:nucleotide-binding universal stress UspA family protein
MNSNILCAFDGSSAALKAFDYAAALAARFDGKLTILAVAQPPEPSEDVETEALLESAQDHFKEQFATLSARAASGGLAPQFEVAAGHPAEQILYLSDKIAADHIVLGHRGKNFFQRWLMGSVSHRVVSYASCSVTIVR